ncbi:MAG: FAD-dependent oxidoreductase, partial [candidate division NC10 bacterium]|nr:FAD-dependent oxidoreductase [candidate division NC10 bacterium]
SPWAPPIPGLADAGFLDSTDALSLSSLPQSLLVIGAGAIGLELGQLFARFGVRVEILEGGPHVAGGEEPEIGEALTRYLADERIRICTGVKIGRVERDRSGYAVHAVIDGKPEVCRGEQLVVATGRRPNTVDLGLAAAGVAVNERGEVTVNQHLQTSNPDVYAAGDCLGDPMYVYVAAYGGNLAAENALTGAGRVYDLAALPHVIFTDPQVASVGLSERAAKAAGKVVRTTVLSLKDVPRALAARDTRGLFKLVAEARESREDHGAVAEGCPAGAGGSRHARPLQARGRGRDGEAARRPRARGPGGRGDPGGDARGEVRPPAAGPRRDLPPVSDDGRGPQARGPDVRQGRGEALLLRDVIRSGADGDVTAAGVLRFQK